MPIRPLSKELQEVAIRELNEVPSRIQADLDHIREWISQQPHLKARTDDQWLIAFLRGSKFSLQRTKEKIDAFYAVRNLAPEFYSNRDPFSPEIQEALCDGVTATLPKTTHPAGSRISISRGYKMDVEKLHLITCFKLVLMMADISLLEDDNFVVCGLSVIWDLKNFPYSYMSQLTMDYCKKMITFSQDVYPVRLKEVNYFNAPSFIVSGFSLIKMLISEKLRNRIFFHAEDETEEISVSKKFPASILPQDYKGEEVSCDELAGYWKKKLESYRDWFLEDAQYGTDESKRPGKPKTIDTMFGLEGSFIKLEID